MPKKKTPDNVVEFNPKQKRQSGQKKTQDGKAVLRRTKVDVETRRKQAVAAKLAGHSVEQIQEEIGFESYSGAYQAIMKGLREAIVQDANDLRAILFARLERMNVAVWDKARAGDPDAINSVIRIAEREAKLLGIESIPLEVSGPGGGPIPGVVMVINGPEEDYVSGLKGLSDGKQA